jgi:hypothetical protein
LRQKTTTTAIVAMQTTANSKETRSRSVVKERKRGRLCEPFRELDRGDDDKDDGATGGDNDKLETLRLRQNGTVVHGSRDRPHDRGRLG